MLDERKAAVLRAVVQEYIRTAQPVGSGHVAAAPEVNVSSATVRNDMAALENEGYLHQPHTSAGRVPTDKGYRYFVDALVEPPHLQGTHAARVRSFFDTAHGELEAMLGQTSDLLSQLTDCAAVVIGPSDETTTLRSIQLVGLTDRLVLCVVVLSSGAVEKHTLELSSALSEEQLHAATAHLSAHLIGSTRTGPLTVPKSGSRPVDRVVDAAAAALDGPEPAEAEHVFVGGAARMVNAFDAIETVRQVLSILEQQFLVVTLVRDVLDRGLSVAIGTETGLEPLSECSLVVSPYSVDGEPVGTVGVLGPTRMDYPQALAAVAVVGRSLGRRLTEG